MLFWSLLMVSVIKIAIISKENGGAIFTNFHILML